MTGREPAPARDHALPVDPGRLLELLERDQLVPRDHARDFAAVVRALEGLLHHELLRAKQRVRRAWDELAGADGAAEARSVAQREHAKDLAATLRRLLRRANFTEVPHGELAEALGREAAFGLRIDLDPSDFVELAAWRRSTVRRTEEVAGPLGLRRRRVVVEAWDRFCIHARFKGAGHFAGRRDSAEKLGLVPGGVVLKLFQNVPKHDIEVLYPGVRVRMRPFDRALIGVPAAAGALHMLVFKLWTSLGALGVALLVFLGLRKEEPELRARAVAACVGLAVLLAFMFRQWMRFLGRKNLLHRRLAEHLQKCTLDAGVGVLLHLIDEAEEEELLEAVLAWSFLLRAGRPLPARELDLAVEAWLRERAGLDVDFEEEDAVAKLEHLGLVERGADGMLRALPPAQARALLADRWRAVIETG